jgi:dolichol-phosphate mannosyltransferase
MDAQQPKREASVVIPCFNEAENIPLLARKVQEVFAQLPDWSYECIFVDDGSTDDTREQLKRLQEESPTVRSLRLTRNMGQSAALVAGIRSAGGEYILTLDGDLQNDPADFPRILELLQDYDCVCGYRATRNDTWVRKISSRVANVVRNWVLHDGIRDSGCGSKGFRKECVEHIVPFNGVHRFFAVLVRNAGFSVVECPVAHHPRIHGVSKYGIGNRLWRGLFDLVGVAWLRKRYVHPTVVGENARVQPELKER